MLEALAADREGMALKELAEVAGTSSAAAYHMAQTLIDQGYARRQGQRYALGSRFAELAAARERHTFLEAVETLLLKVADALPGASVHFSEQVGESVMVTRLVPAGAASRVSTGHHHVLPPYGSGGSLVHLAFWPQEVAEAYEARFPFELYGLPFWRSPEGYRDALARMREEGGLLMPEPVPWRLKYAFPLLRPGGALAGAVTVQWNHAETKSGLEELRRRLEAVSGEAAQTYTQCLKE